MGGVVYALSFVPLPTIPLLVLQTIVGAAVYCLLCHLFRLDSYAYIINYLKELKRKGK